MPTTVVNVSHSDCDVYIGRTRKCSESGVTTADVLCNLYTHLSGTLAQFKVQNRDEAVERHMADLRALPPDVLLAKLKPLVGKRLGCFCVPKRCHGYNYVKLIKELGLE